MGEPLVNVGTAEKPIMVPESALEPNSIKGRDWWEGLASGSVELPDETLDILLDKVFPNK